MTKVLIVDDDLPVLVSTAQLLSSIGFETITTSDPRAVPDTIRRERPDVVLQDVRMPGLDVEELVREIRADPEIERTRIVLFSAGLDLWDMEERMRVSGVLEKPFKPAHAIKVISDAVGEPPRPLDGRAAPRLLTA